MKGYGGYLIVGLLFFLLGIEKIITGTGGLYWGVRIPAWTGWVQLPVGIVFLVVSIRVLWRNRNEPKPLPKIYTDEDAAKAEAEMDALYLREHGELPEKPKSKKPE